MFENNQAFSSFSVNDLQAAKTFYKETLGLNVSDDTMGLELQLATGGRVFIYPKSDHTPATFTILNFRVDDIERAIDDLTARSIRFEIYDDGRIKTDERGIMAAHDHKIAWFKDPAGNFLSIIQEG